VTLSTDEQESKPEKFTDLGNAWRLTAWGGHVPRPPREKTTFKSVTRTHPCELCGGKDGCSRGADGLLFCRRKSGPIDGYGYMGQSKGDEQFALYRRADDSVLQPAAGPGRHPAPPRAPARDLGPEAERYAKALTPELRAELAADLGLPEAALAALPLLGYRVGDGGGCWTFPEVDGAGRLVGISRRYRDGAKKALHGGRRGLTVPLGWDQGDGPVLLPEGPSDTLALAALGLAAVGRPSNTGGVEYLAELLRDVPHDREVVVLAEYDPKADGSWPGRDGARSTAAKLQDLLGRPIKWAMPPDKAKDARAWVQARKLDPTCADSWSVAGQALLDAVLSQCQAVPAEESQGGPPAAPTRVLEPYRPFPVDALPGVLAEFVRQASQALGCDPAFVALPALAVAASAIGNTRTIRPKRGWTEPAIVWTVLIAESGTLKTPAYKMAVGPLFRAQERLMEEFKQQLAEYEAAQNKGGDEGKDDGDPPEKPSLRRVVCCDTTIEKLAELLQDNPRGILVARDELAAWLGSFARYKGKAGGSDLPNWLEMSQAGTIMVDRKTGERRTLFVPRAAVSVCGGIQPGVLARALTQEHFDAGLAARLLVAMPPKVSKHWSEVEVAPEVEETYQDLVDKLLALDFDVKHKKKVPHALTLSAAAKEAWVKFYECWAEEQAAVDGELSSALAKLEAYAARFALLHHVVGCVGRGENDLVPVARESIEAGMTLCRWFYGEVRRVYDYLHETPAERDTGRLVEFIQGRGGQITARELMRWNCRRYPDTGAAEQALTYLVEAGLGRWVEPQTAMKGGRRIKAVELCMTHDSDDTDPVGRQAA
jgi:hypothetical protein